MPTPREVLALVARFQDNRDAYHSGAYNEEQLRKEFLDPFFKALGWDVDNTDGAAEAYKPVVHEGTLRTLRTTEAPDYTFRIGGVRKFFVEAKKPSVDVKEDTHPAYQLRRYAWSAKLPLSILTDFEEFAVYDCTKKPNQKDTAATGRILYFTYDAYPECWEEIALLFSPNAITKGAFDQFAESAKRKKGTATVDDAFLKEIEAWRDTLAHNLALRNTGLSQRELNVAVQTTIDRIIFLRICEDRGIEEYGVLRGLLNGERVYPRLVELFRAADERYNSGLFHFKAEKDRPGQPDTLTLSLEIDDKVLKEILRSLYYPESPYEFSVLSADILGHVYEQFLGKVIRLTAGHHAKVEEKPEVKKAGGVYYTPTYIVDYIVKNTVGKLLEGKTPKETATLRVLDPACGSGSFLLGAYQCLLDWHETWYAESDAARWAKGRSPRLYRSPKGEWRLTIAEKKRILLDHIFGVDIDPQAVEVTKLSLLLKVLEGENAEVLESQLRLFRERALPDLGHNIQCGNSLIGPDFYDDHPLETLSEEERYRINAFDWETAFPEIMKQGGFDAVIGNPPYVRQEMLAEFKPYFQRRYTVYHGSADLYAYFIERGISLLRPEGIFSYIVANKWLRANYGEPLREWLKEQRIEEIVDFDGQPVFKSATTYPCILRTSKGRPLDTFPVTKIVSLEFPSLASYVEEHHHRVSRAALHDDGWSLSDVAFQSLFDKLKAVGVSLGEYVGGKIYRGILTGLNEAFVIDATVRQRLIDEDPKSAEIIKPFLIGRDIKRYQSPQSDRFLVFTRHGINIEGYPAIEQYLSQFKARLTPKPPGWKGDRWGGRKPGTYHWYEVQDTIAYWRAFDEPKIVVPAIVRKASYSFDTDGHYSNDKTTIIPTEDFYLLGLLNSHVLDFIMHSISSTKQGGYFEYKPMYLSQLPIRVLDVSDAADRARHTQIVELVRQILALHKQLRTVRTDHERTLLHRQIEATDRKIDQLAYELYGLTDEEVRIVEETTK